MLKQNSNTKIHICPLSTLEEKLSKTLMICRWHDTIFENPKDTTRKLLVNEFSKWRLSGEYIQWNTIQPLKKRN